MGLSRPCVQLMKLLFLQFILRIIALGIIFLAKVVDGQHPETGGSQVVRCPHLSGCHKYDAISGCVSLKFASNRVDFSVPGLAFQIQISGKMNRIFGGSKVQMSDGPFSVVSTPI